MSPVSSKKLFSNLLNTCHWTNDTVTIFGKTHYMKRQSAWHGLDEYVYSYSGISRKALPFTEELMTIQALIEKTTSEKFNACLLNYYPDGNDGMGWHADNEKSIVENSCIASLSLGASRIFRVKHQSSNLQLDIPLQNGQLITMSGSFQKHWKHTLLKTKKVKEARINLTFRLMR